MEIVSREHERQLIRDILASERPELVAVWGRRRVGKTYLVHNAISTYKKSGDIFLTITGARKLDGAAQDVSNLISNFRVSVVNSLGIDPEVSGPTDLFVFLTKIVRQARADGKRLLLFMDEFPWLCEVKGTNFDFYQSFEHLWNNVLEQSGSKVFVCGSAASWMLKNIVYPRDGLAKRVTHKLKLLSFNLSETRRFLERKGLRLSVRSIAEVQMVLGGIPFYLEQFKPQESVQENLYRLMIHADGILSGAREYQHLFAYLFSDPAYYTRLVSVVASRRSGFSLLDIAAQMSSESSSKVSDKLLDALAALTESEIFAKRNQFANRAKGVHYFLIDPYIRFFNRWIASEPDLLPDYSAFCRLLESQAFKSWQGFNFELLCFRHYRQIAKALGIAGISVVPHMLYVYDPNHRLPRCQIDLLLDRADRMVTICEAKYYDGPYELKEDEYHKMLARREALASYVASKRLRKRDFNFCLLHLDGIERNKYLELLNPSIISVEDLAADL